MIKLKLRNHVKSAMYSAQNAQRRIMSSHNSRETQGHSVQSSINPDDIPLVSFPAWAVLALGLRDSYI